MIELNKIYNEDCLEGMKRIPDKSVDMILCDLPYGTTQCKWDTIIPFEPLWEQYHRVAKDNAAIVLFCQQPFTTALISNNIKEFKYCWIWYKHNATGFLNAKKQPLRETEDIAVFYNKQCTYNPQMRKGKYRAKGNGSSYSKLYGSYDIVTTANDIYYPKTILDFVGVSNAKRQHQTQKPVALCEYLIKTYTNEGETVLDNCIGSGTTAIACLSTGRKYIGFELDEEYYTKACERIEQWGKEQNPDQYEIDEGFYGG